MATNLTDLTRKRRKPDPRKIKKHSDIMRRRGTNVNVGGNRQATETGYEVPGFKGKSFETSFEMMLAGTSTATVKHEKKDRTIRVLTGVLYVMLEDAEGKQSQKRAIAGDEVILERGTAYRLATSSENVEMIICQQAKYDATLETLNESTLNGREVPQGLLESTESPAFSGQQQQPTRRRRGSRAKEQQKMFSRNKNASPRVAEPIPGREGHVEPKGEAPGVETVFGKNPQPSYGRY